MEVALVTLSNELYGASRRRLIQSAIAHGIDRTYSYDFEALADDPFFLRHERVLRAPKGMGYWLWKPFIIDKTLRELADGTVLAYIDAGTEIIADIRPLLALCSAADPVLLFGNGTDTNARWTKRDTFALMECDQAAYWHGPHCDASVVIVRKDAVGTAFVGEWLSYCTQPAILTDAPNVSGLANLPVYEDHRYDQSVLSLVAQRHRITLHRAPSQFGNHYKTYDLRVPGEFNCSSQWDQTQLGYYSPLCYHNSPYGQLTDHHRTKSTAATPPVPASLKARIKRKLKRGLGTLIAR